LQHTFSDFEKENSKKTIPVLITNNHVLSQDYLDESEIIEFTLNENKIKKEIKLTKKRRNYTNEEFDVTIIEIFPEKDSIDRNSFLDVDPNIIYEDCQKRFKNKHVYIIGNIDEISNGILKYIYEDGIKMEYFFSTEPGMSGSPIINLNNYKVIGVHKGASLKKTSNYGTFLRERANQRVLFKK
jgi:V8-like Glu-specific endopeptidase